MDEALETAVFIAPAETYVELGNMLHLAFVFIGDGAVERYHGDDICSGFLQGSGQGTRDVAQTTGLDERSRLGRSKDDVHLPRIV